jgi:coenzyme PQQ precursor peptide PqqA
MTTHSDWNGKTLEIAMKWTRPKLREICIGLEINGYLEAKL